MTSKLNKKHKTARYIEHDGTIYKQDERSSKPHSQTFMLTNTGWHRRLLPGGQATVEVTVAANVAPEELSNALRHLARAVLAEATCATCNPITFETRQVADYRKRHV